MQTCVEFINLCEIVKLSVGVRFVDFLLHRTSLAKSISIGVNECGEGNSREALLTNPSPFQLFNMIKVVLQEI